jgi:hypothetical protein
MAIWCSLWSFGIFFPCLNEEKSGNPAPEGSFYNMSSVNFETSIRRIPLSFVEFILLKAMY